MEEDIKEIIKVFKGLEFETYEWNVYYDGKLQINCDTMNIYLENILNELERLQRDNNALEMTHDYDVNMIDEVKGEYVKLSKEFKTLKNDSIPKQVIRDKLEELEEDNYDGEQYQLEIQGKIELLKELLGE